MLTEAEILSKLRDSMRLCGERCESISRLGALGGGWMEISRAIDEIEGCCRQMCHWRGDTRWLSLARLYGTKTKDVGRTLYLLADWPRFKAYGMIFAQGMSGMERLAERPTGQSGPILPKLAEPDKESVH